MLGVSLLAFILFQSTAEKVGLQSWVPNNLVGILTALSVSGLLIDRIKNRGKKEGVDETTVNGIGKRVESVEAKHKTLEGQFVEHQRSVDRVLVQNDNLLREIGKAERSVDQCHEDTEKFTIELGAKVDTMRREVIGEIASTRRELDQKIGDLNVAVEGVKTEVRMRAEFDAREERRRP